VRGASCKLVARFEALFRAAPPAALRLALGDGRALFGTLSERLFGALPEHEAIFLDTTGRAIADCVYVVAHSGTGLCVALGAGLAERRATTAAERARFARLAAHLGAGLRLRESLAAGESPRGVLRDAVRSRAPVQPRDGTSAALDLWRGLITGRWSLVDRFETDGKRFIVAHPCDPAVGDPRALTPREREVAEHVGLGRPNKVIAYALGVSLAAVSNAVASACRKLGGLRGRSELAGFFAPGGLRTRLCELELCGERIAVGVQAELPRERLGALTRAECDVACELARGATVAAIARRRGSSPYTVETQVKAVYAKLGVGSRVELASRLEAATEARAVAL
jgi:DNA-binding NarL/FixJ family response regulator